MPAVDDSDVIRGNVRAELARAGTNAAAMDRRLGWSTAHLSRRLLRHSDFRGHELVAIARELGIPVARFFVGVTTDAPVDASIDDPEVPRARTG